MQNYIENTTKTLRISKIKTTNNKSTTRTLILTAHRKN